MLFQKLAVIVLLASDSALGARINIAKRHAMNNVDALTVESVNASGAEGIENPTKVLRDLSVTGLDKFKNFKHVAAYIIVEPADPDSKPKIILQNPVPAHDKHGKPLTPSWQTMGGYKASQSLPYKTHAIRSEMYDEGNIVVTDDNLIRASPVYITKHGALLQVYYLREGDWLKDIGSWEFGQRGHHTKKIVHPLDLYNDAGQGVETYLKGFRGYDRGSLVWLKEGGVIDAIQDEDKAAKLWEAGVLQTFDAEVAEEGWFKQLTARLAKPEMKTEYKKVLTSAWKPVEKKKSYYIP